MTSDYLGFFVIKRFIFWYKQGMIKDQLGQFFTTNSDYILQGLERYVKGKEITDPFAGNQDLFVWAKKM